jgi:glycosyltransferase involved in cell wall biosynthesis
MRVAQVINAFSLGGTQKAACVLAQRLACLGHEAWVIGFTDGPRRLHERRDNLTHVLLNESTIPALLECLRSIGPDVVHIHASGYAEGMIRAIRSDPALGRAAVVSTPVFGRPPKESRTLDLTATCVIGAYVYYRLLQWLRLGATEALARGIAFVRLNIADPPEIPVSSLDSPEILRERRSQLGIPTDGLVIGRIGRNDPTKWNRSSEAALTVLLEKLPQIAWTSIGFPAQLGLERLKARWGPRFTNFDETSDSDRLSRILASLDLQLFFSRFGECFAFSICEAAAVGVPTVALCTPSRDNGQSEQIVDGVSGYLVSDRHEAAATIARLVQDPAGLARLKQATLDLNRSRSGGEVVMPRLLDFYEYCLSGRRRTLAFSQDMIQEHVAFAAAYRQRIARAMSRNVLGQWRWQLQLAAQENYFIFRSGRSIRRLLSTVPPDGKEFM